jgi:hypothetical protein
MAKKPPPKPGKMPTTTYTKPELKRLGNLRSMVIAITQ